jgi:hypothetical protein
MWQFADDAVRTIREEFTRIVVTKVCIAYMWVRITQCFSKCRPITLLTIVNMWICEVHFSLVSLVSLTNIKNRKMKHHVELYPVLYTEASWIFCSTLHNNIWIGDTRSFFYKMIVCDSTSQLFCMRLFLKQNPTRSNNWWSDRIQSRVKRAVSASVTCIFI